MEMEDVIERLCDGIDDATDDWGPEAFDMLLRMLREAELELEVVENARLRITMTTRRMTSEERCEIQEVLSW
jgi:hypothetical protein